METALTAASPTSVQVSLQLPANVSYSIHVIVVRWSSDVGIDAGSVWQAPYTHVSDVLALTASTPGSIVTDGPADARMWSVTANATAGSGAVVVRLPVTPVAAVTITVSGLETGAPYAVFAACNNIGDDIGPFAVAQPATITLLPPHISGVAFALRFETAMVTQGGTQLSLRGNQTGIAATTIAITLVNAHYTFTSSQCDVVVPQSELVCSAPSGVGTNFSVVLLVGGTSSLPFLPIPPLSFGPPTIAIVQLLPATSDPRAVVGATVGGSVAVIGGANFGSAALSAVSAVTYTYVGRH